MAFNVITGSLVGPATLLGDIVVTGSFSGSGENLFNVPRVSNAVNNSLITNVAGDANTFTCESNLLFDGSTLDVTGHVTASQGISASYFFGDGSQLTGITAGGGGNANAQGPDFSVQFTTGSGGLSGSGDLIFSSSVLTLTGNLHLSGTASMEGPIIPVEPNIYDLGTSANPWRNLYISSSTIYFGSNTLSVEGNNLKFGSGSTTKGFDVGFMNFHNNGIFMDQGRVFQLRAYQMQFYGGISYVRKATAVDYTIKLVDFIVAAVSEASSDPITLTLPTATACSNGQTFIIKDEGGAADSANVTIACQGSDTIDGASSVTLVSPYASIQVYSNGTDKFYIL
tara:strand:+ start:715 stop:1734 length:1020 start_codon:yes stop_codon:yes gene_type:complete